MVDLPQFYDEKTFEKKPSRIKYVGTCTGICSQPEKLIS